MNASMDAFILPSRDEVNRLIHNFRLIFFILIAPSIQKIWDWFSKPIKRYSLLAIPENLMSDCNDFPCWHWSHLSLLSADYLEMVNGDCAYSLTDIRIDWSGEMDMFTIHLFPFPADFRSIKFLRFTSCRTPQYWSRVSSSPSLSSFSFLHFLQSLGTFKRTRARW